MTRYRVFFIWVKYMLFKFHLHIIQKVAKAFHAHRWITSGKVFLYFILKQHHLRLSLGREWASWHVSLWVHSVLYDATSDRYFQVDSWLKQKTPSESPPTLCAQWGRAHASARHLTAGRIDRKRSCTAGHTTKHLVGIGWLIPDTKSCFEHYSPPKQLIANQWHRSVPVKTTRHCKKHVTIAVLLL